MREFIDLLTHRATGNRVPIRSSIQEMRATNNLSIPRSSVLVEYEIESAFYQRIACDPANLGDALKNCRRQLQEYLYGRFRNDLIELEMAIYSHETERAGILIRKIFNDLYD
jgi:hypothetical protein